MQAADACSIVICTQPVVMLRQEVDLLLAKWECAWVQLARAEGLYEASGCKRRPRHRTGCCSCWGAGLSA